MRLTESADAAIVWADLADPLDSTKFDAAWLTLQCEQLGDVTCAVLVMGPPDTGPFLPTAFWPAQAQASDLVAEVADLALQSRAPTLVQREAQSALAYPVLVDGHLHGLIALETPAQSAAQAQSALRKLQWGVQGLAASLRSQQARRDQATSDRLMQVLDLMAATMTEQRFADAAHALVTDLAIRFACDRVAVGFRREGHVTVAAVSHSAQIGKRMNLIAAIEAAMDEAIDQKSLVQLPLEGEEKLVTRDHAALARQHGSDCILTVPFVSPRLVAGAATFERSGARPFTLAEVELCQAVVALSSRILEDKRLNDRGLLSRMRDQALESVHKITGPRHFAHKVAASVLMLAGLFFSFASGTYTVGANAVLEGTIRRVLVVPFDGYIETSSSRAGDVVKAGAVLATLDQRDLQLEYLRWSSQADQFGSQQQEALAKSERVQVSVTSSQVQQVQAQMNLLAEQLARARITAPFDGVVVSGDLSQALGSAVKRGQTLFEIAPLNAYRVILEVNESDIDGVKEGLHGELMLAALPGESFPLLIKHLTPVATAREGHTFYRVEASVERISARMRPGMEGVGKISIGERKLLWQWTHKLVDWLRLSLWSWM
jgi:RND family efflux transporter MFP subunit